MAGKINDSADLFSVRSIKSLNPRLCSLADHLYGRSQCRVIFLSSPEVCNDGHLYADSAADRSAGI